MDAARTAQLRRRVSDSFSPGAPINQQALFAGRVPQLRTVFEAIGQRGQHAMIYGERGVGKTSIANTVGVIVQTVPLQTCRINCDSADSYTSIWRKVFREIVVSFPQTKIGFGRTKELTTSNLSSVIGDTIGPDDIRQTLAGLDAPIVMVLDEIDQIANRSVTKMLAETVKALSDHSVRSTIILVGVADNVSDLIAEHQSIERCLVQVPMPRMSRAELGEILAKGFGMPR